MHRGDLIAVLVGLALVILLTAALSPPARSPVQVPATLPPTTVQATPVTPVPGTPEETVTPGVTGTTPFPVKRIVYTTNYVLLPVRYLPNDMAIYGFSDAQWKYTTAVPFAFIEENHGGITETFTVPYAIWRMVATVNAERTPEKATFRMVLVDEESGRIVEGAEIHFPGTVTKTVVVAQRPLYMVIETEDVDSFIITFEAPSELIK